jgi:hypothetical protein
MSHLREQDEVNGRDTESDNKIIDEGAGKVLETHCHLRPPDQDNNETNQPGHRSLGCDSEDSLFLLVAELRKQSDSVLVGKFLNFDSFDCEKPVLRRAQNASSIPDARPPVHRSSRVQFSGMVIVPLQFDDI